MIESTLVKDQWCELRPRLNQIDPRSGHKILYFNDRIYTYGGFELDKSLLKGLYSIEYQNGEIGK